MELPLDLNRPYTFADYLTWTDNQMLELLHGFIRQMPEEKVKHAVVLSRARDYIDDYMEKNTSGCQVFYAPFDVRFPKNPVQTADHQISTVLHPDICVVFDASKIDERGCLGAPDVVIEIESAVSQLYDWNRKHSIYEAGGVKEYWVISSGEEGITVFQLQNNGTYGIGAVYEGNMQASSQLLQGLSMNTETLFKDIS